MKKEDFDFYDRTSLKSYNLEETMKYQLNRLESLDPATRQHSENVANLTCRICEYLHLSKNFTVYATMCAYLHDIGKLFIPKEILLKPDVLTDEEYEIIKSHTTLGAKLCMQEEKLRMYVAGPLYHHEALNGSGYPEGLTKKDIPFVGQIIRVADEYDAIVSKRAYKSHVGITETLKILIENTRAQTPKSVVLKSMEENTKIGKLNPKVVKKLFKVVIDDTLYEISCIFDYTKYLDEQIRRLETINDFNLKMQNAKTEKKKEYYKEGMEVLFEGKEDFRNYKYVLEEYRTAHIRRKEIIESLYDEIKLIKKLRV